MALRRLLQQVMAATLLALGLVPAQAAADGVAPLRLRWALERNVFTPQTPEGRAQAVFSLTNLGAQPLPAQGWALYFNCVSGVVAGDLAPSPFRLEQVSGTWYRLRPTAGFQGLPAGQTLDLRYLQPEAMAKLDKAPTGPYVVFDDAPGVGQAIADYQRLPLTRPEQLDKGPGDAHPVITAADLFERNQRIQDLPEAALPPVFPSPLSFERQAGALSWSRLPQVIAAPALRAEAAWAKALLAPHFKPGAPGDAAHPLRLVLAPLAGQTSAEAYELSISAKTGVSLSAKAPEGIARGLQSLRQLLPAVAQPGQPVALPELRITDAPRFAYRGLMLDVARNFHDKATVLRLLDLMARFKLNKFHFHLTDDEGWRLAIKGLPELTTVGARRGHTLDSRAHLQPAYGSGPDVRDPHGSGFYSAADYIEILRYAAARHIEVIPEIEMPGHARAAVKAMESRTAQRRQAGLKNADDFLLSDPADASGYRSPQHYTDHVMNPGLPSTYAFIEHVVAEVVALHKAAGVPARSIHVGADELPVGAWEKSPASQALMKQLKLAGTADLWDHFYTRVDQILRRHGVAASGWEELGAVRAQVAGVSKQVPNPLFTRHGFTLFVWNNTDDSDDMAYRLANAGYRTVLAPATRLYFDMAHNKNPEEPGVNWAAYTDLDALYDYIPFDDVRKSPTDATPIPGKDRLTAVGQQYILGLEGTLFSETMRDPERIDYLLMPRLLGLAERAWSPDPAWARERDPATAARLHDAAWSVFVNQLGKQVLPRLDAEQPDLHYRIPPPGLQRDAGQWRVNHQLPGMTLRYTSDGSEPTPQSPRVPADGAIAAAGPLQVAAFDRNGRRGRASQTDNQAKQGTGK